jgi:CRP/FNR family transcriptional regulator, cyclic AMP receptor protein
LLDVDDGMRRAVPAWGVSEARELAVVPGVRLRRGAWSPRVLCASPDSGFVADSRFLGLLVVSGLLLRSVSVGNRRGAALVGPGDFVRPALAVRHAAPPRIVGTWDVLEPTVLAWLDGRFAQRVARWPEITATLLERSDEAARLAAFQLALTQIRRVEERLLLLLWRLAGRWGQVTPSGVALNLRLTHETLARLVGVKRPTVTSGLAALRHAGVLEYASRRGYLLTGEPQDICLAARTVRPRSEKEDPRADDRTHAPRGSAAAACAERAR